MELSIRDEVNQFVLYGNKEKPLHREPPKSKVKLCAAYLLRHLKTGRIYIGSSSDIYYRLFKHQSLLRLKGHQNKKLQILYNEDPAFDEFVIVTNTVDEALDFEQALLDIYHGSTISLNTAPNARKSGVGWERDIEYRSKISAAHKGKALSAEHKNKISKAQIGRPKTPEQIEKSRIGRLGYKPTQATIEKVADSLRGKKRSSEVVEKMRLGHVDRAKRVSIDGVEYASIRGAARILDIAKATVKTRVLDEARPAWFYIE